MVSLIAKIRKWLRLGKEKPDATKHDAGAP